MAALYNSAGDYIFALWFLLSFYLVFFRRLFSAVVDWMSVPYFHTWWGRSANWDAGLKRAARGSRKIQDAKIAKNLPSGHHRTTLLGYIFAIKGRIDNRKKNLTVIAPPYVLIIC